MLTYNRVGLAIVAIFLTVFVILHVRIPFVLLRWTGSSFLRQHRGEVRVPERIARGCCVEKTSCRPRIGQVFHDLRTLSAWVFQPRDKIDGEFDFSTQLDDVKLVARSAAG